MKKLVYLFVFIIASASLASCGASSSSCVATERYQIKNIKFENQEVVITDDIINQAEGLH